MRPSRRQFLAGGAALGAGAAFLVSPRRRWSATEDLWETGRLEPANWLVDPEELGWDGYHYGYWDLRPYERAPRRIVEDWSVPEPAAVQRAWPMRTVKMLESVRPAFYGKLHDLLLIEVPRRDYTIESYYPVPRVLVFTGTPSVFDSHLEDARDAASDEDPEGVREHPETEQYGSFALYHGLGAAVGKVDGTTVGLFADTYSMRVSERPDGHDYTNLSSLKAVIDAGLGNGSRLQDAAGHEAAGAIAENVSWEDITVGVAHDRNRFSDLLDPGRPVGTDRSVPSAALTFDTDEATFAGGAAEGSVDVAMELAADGPIDDGAAFADSVPVLDSWPDHDVDTVEGPRLRVTTTLDAEALRGEPLTPVDAPASIEASGGASEVTVRYTGDWSFPRGTHWLRGIGPWEDLEWSGPSDARYVRRGDETTVTDDWAEPGDVVALTYYPEADIHRRVEDTYYDAEIYLTTDTV